MNQLTKVSSVTATYLTEHTASVIKRVQDGERIFIIKNSKVIAVIEPTDFRGFVK